MQSRSKAQGCTDLKKKRKLPQQACKIRTFANRHLLKRYKRFILSSLYLQITHGLLNLFSINSRRAAAWHSFLSLFILIRWIKAAWLKKQRVPQPPTCHKWQFQRNVFSPSMNSRCTQKLTWGRVCIQALAEKVSIHSAPWPETKP